MKTRIQFQLKLELLQTLMNIYKNLISSEIIALKQS